MSLSSGRLGCKLIAPEAHQGVRAALSRTQRAQLPPAVDQTAKFNVITDQKGLGSCVPTSVATSCQQRMAMQGLGSWLPARLALYRQSLEADGTYPEDEGTYPETTIKIASERGFGPEDAHAYSDKPDAIRRALSAEYVAKAARHRLVTWSPLDRDRDTVKFELFSGNPIVISMLLHESFDHVASDGKVSVPKDSEEESGGHAMRIVGYDESYVLTANSWGRGWGMRGYCWIPWRLIEDRHTTRSLHAIQVVQFAT